MRPTVWRIATDLGIVGEVWNDGAGVVIEAWGSPEQLNLLSNQLQQQVPPLAKIDSLERRHIQAEPPVAFVIRPSNSNPINTGLPADAATCPQCLQETLNPKDRRYGYAFTNCTQCGPRLSIVHTLPYDRAQTSMTAFPLCPQCQQEFNDVSDRRYHAQPNACPACGPNVWMTDSNAQVLSCSLQESPISHCARLIKAGSIIAIKGIGGFHLACDAHNLEAVTRLRQKKARPHKALALMAKDTAMIRAYCSCNKREESLLNSTAAPIVLMQKRSAESELASNIAPGQSHLGFMLPYTPLHHLLFSFLEHPLVMTSGNPSHQPQCIENQNALDQLSDIADYFLMHDRAIINRVDDSVTRVVANKRQTLRRARGYAPEGLPVPTLGDPGCQILAMGADLKNTFCQLREGTAVVSQHMGDLTETHTRHSYRHNLKLYKKLFGFTPSAIAVDLHQDYASTKLGIELAEENDIPIVSVQHHHAHVAACMAEHQLANENVLGVVMDGMGMGENGEIWGAEFIKANYFEFTKLAGFEPIPLLGGNKAMVQPWRNTLSYLFTLDDWPETLAELNHLPLIQLLQQQPLDTLEQMHKRGINSPSASSAGRLFDGAAAALGIHPHHIHYEGQAAIELEAIANAKFKDEQHNGYGNKVVNDHICWQPLWCELINDLKQNTAKATIAARFHHGLINGIAEMAQQLCQRENLARVVLSGGCMQNQLLLRGLITQLSKQNIEVFFPQQIPANDGGIALGQAMVASAKIWQ